MSPDGFSRGWGVEEPLASFYYTFSPDQGFHNAFISGHWSWELYTVGSITSSQ